VFHHRQPQRTLAVRRLYRHELNPGRRREGILKSRNAIIVRDYSKHTANDRHFAVASKNLYQVIARKLSTNAIVSPDVTELPRPRCVIVHDQHWNSRGFSLVEHRRYFSNSTRHDRESRYLFQNLIFEN